MIRRGATLALLVAAAACATLDGRGPLRRTQTTERGVCARLDASAFFRLGAAAACARTRPGREGFRPFLYAEISAADEDREYLQPGAWRVQVLRPDGTALHDGPADLRESHSLLPICSYGVCKAFVSAKLDVPEPWRTGTYRIRYLFLPRPFALDLAITLE